MTSTSIQTTNNNSLVGGVTIDYEAVLKTLNLNPRDAATQALVLTCERYALDPVLKHMVLIQSTPYVTHKGLWHIAHRSGELDGEDVITQGETDREWFATVGIYRKGWSHPITMTGRYPKSSSNKHYGPEMAVVRAECLVLRRLFDVAVPVQEERDWEREQAPAPPRATERAIEPAKPVDADGVIQEPRSTRRPPPSQGRRPAASNAGSEPAGSVTPADEVGGAAGSATGAPAAVLASDTERESLKRRVDALTPDEQDKLKQVWHAAGYAPLTKLPAKDVGKVSDLITQYEEIGS